MKSVSRRDPRAIPIAGCVEGVADGRLHGWACDRRIPSRPVSIVLRGDDGRVLTLLAERARADVFAAGFGAGHSGFSIPLRRLSGLHSLRVFAGEEGVELQGSPFALRGAKAPVARRAGRLTFGIDPVHLSGAAVTGWAVDTGDPSRRCRIALMREGRILAETTASRFRSDLATAPDALHGFLLRLPAGERRGLKLLDRESGVALGPVG
jgi:hypothetical protein